MALPNYPNNPTLGQQFVVGTNTMQWDGEKWKVLAQADLNLRNDLVAGTAYIGNKLSADVAIAADIALGNFVTPDQFFTGDAENPNADYLTAFMAAVATGKRVLMQKEYGLSNQLNLVEGSKVSGMNRVSTGLRRLALGAAGAVLAFSANGVELSNFKVDAANLGGAPDARLNCVAVNGEAKRFNISQVDVYNGTGYGHVTFGSESNPQIEGVYNDCYVANCQVLFEQIGALDVTLYDCDGLGTEGRTLSIFHPYAGSKKVTYVNCHGRGFAGAGIEVIVTNGHPLGPFTFINSSINIVGTTSAIYSLVLGDTAAQVDMHFQGGSYKTTAGQSVTIGTAGKFKAVGTEFIGAGGFNCPTASPLNDIELGCCLIEAEANSATGGTYALITNGSNPRVIGGKIIAKNSLAGGAFAVLGAATISKETVLVPAPAQPPNIPYIAQSAGVTAFQIDASTTGFQNIGLPVNTVREKVVFKCSISNSTDAYLSGADNVSWAMTGPDAIRVRYVGNSVANLLLHYEIGILP